MQEFKANSTRPAALTSSMNLTDFIILKIWTILKILIDLTIVIANDNAISFCAL